MAVASKSEASLQPSEQETEHNGSSTNNGVEDVGEMCTAQGSPSGGQRPPVLIIVMGVSGTGKSTLAHAIADSLHLPYIEGDSLHPAENVAKMASNIPLTDADRAPWLAHCRATAERVVRGDRDVEGLVAEGWDNAAWEEAHGRGVVLTCSSLKRVYREVLRGNVPSSAILAPPTEKPAPASEPGVEEVAASKAAAPVPGLRTVFVYIDGPKDLLLGRMKAREGHYMKADMLQSQLDTLQTPVGEDGVVQVSAEQSTEEQVSTALDALRKLAVI
ncbi:hypothetical protein CERSUDRAFT_114314 [Gelatoporia subvermispora B]|uniref:gluconokinase n=1 Tax=Ceriporiopsis subvermispora (strain B) TaxID=914234 RepID=M2PMN8_CERS8|nr:hypothetical protein CERSUDRAFT_114314 [Gelatoporia subvermispora B]